MLAVYQNDDTIFEENRTFKVVGRMVKWLFSTLIFIISRD